MKYLASLTKPTMVSCLLSVLLLVPSLSTFVAGLAFHHSHPRTSLSRRDALISAATILVAPSPSLATETIGKADDCNDSTCLGVWDGLLADCPHTSAGGKLLKTGAGCVCSQDDTPGIFSEP